MQLIQKKHQLVWNDWRSQLQHCLTTIEQLQKWINVTEDEEQIIKAYLSKSGFQILLYSA